MFEDDLLSFQQGVKALPGKFDKSAVTAINKAASQARSLARQGIAKQVNLTSYYINQHLKISSPATSSRLEAVISAEVRGVLLNRFDGLQVTTNVKHPSRSRGDRLRGIPAGKKSRGATVQVKKHGSRKFLPAFYLPLKNGNGVNGMALAVRTGKGKKAIKVLSGPSVSQVFQTVKDDVSPEVQELVVNALLDEMELL